MSDNTSDSLRESTEKFLDKRNTFLSLVSRLAINCINYSNLNDPDALSNYLKKLNNNFVSTFSPQLTNILNELITVNNIKELSNGNKTPIICSIIKYPFKVVSSYFPEQIKNSSDNIIDDIFSEKNVKEVLDGNLKPIIETIKEKGVKIFGNVAEIIEKPLEKFKENSHKLLSELSIKCFNMFFDKNKNYIPEILHEPIKKVGQSILSEDFINKPIKSIFSYSKNYTNNLSSKKEQELNNLQQIKNLSNAIEEMSAFNKIQSKSLDNMNNITSEINNVFGQEQNQEIQK